LDRSGLFSPPPPPSKGFSSPKLVVYFYVLPLHPEQVPPLPFASGRASQSPLLYLLNPTSVRMFLIFLARKIRFLFGFSFIFQAASAHLLILFSLSLSFMTSTNICTAFLGRCQSFLSRDRLQGSLSPFYSNYVNVSSDSSLCSLPSPPLGLTVKCFLVLFLSLGNQLPLGASSCHPFLSFCALCPVHTKTFCPALFFCPFDDEPKVFPPQSVFPPFRANFFRDNLIQRMAGITRTTVYLPSFYRFLSAYRPLLTPFWIWSQVAPSLRRAPTLSPLFTLSSDPLFLSISSPGFFSHLPLFICSRPSLPSF